MKNDLQQVRELIDAARPVPFEVIEDLSSRVAARRSPHPISAIAIVGVLMLTVAVGAFALSRYDFRPANQRGISTPPMSVQEVYERATRALSKPGFVYHDTMSAGSGKLFEGKWKVERWADITRDLAREEEDHESGDSVAIIRDGGSYSRNVYREISQRRASQCGGGSAATSLILGCEYHTDRATMQVESGEFRGKPAVVLVQKASYLCDGSCSFVERLYLDGATFLPIGREREYEKPTGDERESVIYEHDFIPANSLPKDFFDPHAIGADQPPDLKPLDRDWGIPVYWLGTEYRGVTRLPPLVLREISPSGGDPFKFSLKYQVDLEAAFVSITEYDTASWRQVLRNSDFGRQPCEMKRDIRLPTGHATIYYWYDFNYTLVSPEEVGKLPCSQRRNRSTAHVYLESSVAMIDPILADDEPNAYNNPDIIEALARDLHLREPPK